MAQTRRESPLARLRYRVAAANLARHLPGEPCRVLDVAGGAGGDALPLAALGHEVTLVDPAGALLECARTHAEGLPGRVHVVQAHAEDVPHLFTAAAFDVVLCHGLLHHVDDRVALLRAVTAPLRPGGLLSVVGPNPAADPLVAAAGEGDLDRALALAGSGRVWVQEVRAALPACTADDVRADLTALGAEPIAHYGIRCVADLVAPPVDPDALEVLELALADRMPYPLLARFFHLLARRG
ncbi:class I SAM-dependent methyltransferase [Actinokineospora spheciospongiae]|uniref:class I SAM-dependent methyltransferase n=1 Tax=Actinokineospora spheciospongiae TaxID=909613 RepID=UPI00054D972F|nr:class I SAM-dependent methyltransferase [Actinokineospora spheciospongiae]